MGLMRDLLAGVIVTLALSGCVAGKSVDPVPSDELIGTWTSSDPAFHTALTLYEDATFRVEALPNEMVMAMQSGTVDLSGTWSIGEPYAGTQRVELVGNSVSGGKYVLPLLVHSVDSEIGVFFILGDPDSLDWLRLRK